MPTGRERDTKGMRVWLWILLASLLLRGEGVYVAAVVRQGLPPYAPAERLYRLEGKGAADLKRGDLLQLKRLDGSQESGLLRVIQTGTDGVFALLVGKGETYPIKGDRAFNLGGTDTLPILPPMNAEPLPWATTILPSPDPGPPPPALSPANTQAQPSGPLAGARMGNIYFLVGNASISPAGKVRLKAWMETWTEAKRWMLSSHPVTGEKAAVSQARIEAMREELRRLGATEVQEGSFLLEAPKDLPFVSVMGTP
jgi:hypothetical protein